MAKPTRRSANKTRNRNGGETHQPPTSLANTLTTNHGLPISDNQNTLKSGVRGPSLLEDNIFREKITHFDHERIPERVVHARGSAAHGYFEAGRGASKFSKAAFLQPGKRTPKEMIADVKEGLYVTEFLGHGANLVTGDYSRGASGLWISGGELTYPVEEITVAGNLKEMFMNISEIASDLEFRGSVASPTLRIDGLTVGGE